MARKKLRSPDNPANAANKEASDAIKFAIYSVAGIGTLILAITVPGLISSSHQAGVIRSCNTGNLAACSEVRDKIEIKNQDYWRRIRESEEAKRLSEIDRRAQEREDERNARTQQQAEDLLGDLRRLNR